MLAPLGADGFHIRFGDALSETSNRSAQQFASLVEAANPSWLMAISSALTSSYVRFDLAHCDGEEIRGWLESQLKNFDPKLSAIQARRRLIIPCVFGGDAAPQLEEAAALAGTNAQRAIEEITSTNLRVLAIGFAPGQPYLGELPEHWNIPRQTALTPQVETGAVVVAIRQIVLFSKPSQTGWRQIGRCGFRAFQPESETPFPLKAGDEVRFASAPQDALPDLLNAPDGKVKIEAL